MQLEGQSESKAPHKGYDFCPDKFIEPFKRGDFIAVSAEITVFIDHFNAANVIGFSQDDINIMNQAAQFIFAAIADPVFVIPDLYITKFVVSATLFDNLAKIVGMGNTDQYLDIIASQPNNIFKIMTLYTPSNSHDIPISEIFKAQPIVATQWFSWLTNNYRGITQDNYRRFRKWLLDEEIWKYYTITGNNFRQFDWLTHPGFDISYISPQHEKRLRQHIVKDVQQIKLQRTKPISNNFKNVLVVSSTFLKGKAVFKPIANYLKELRKADYNLTYLHCSHDGKLDRVDHEIFNKAIPALTQEKGIFPEAMKELQEGDYGVIIYPDTWLNFNNILLGCSRLAPIQITTYGHPASSQCTEIDYFIGGQETEAPHTYQNYSERLILLPDNGNSPIPIENAPVVEEAEDYMICLSWGFIKLNWDMIDLLLKLREKCENNGKQVKFYFADCLSAKLTYLRVRKELEEIFGSTAVVMPSLEYPKYMEGIGQCKFAIDSYPFGGFNRVLDLLAMNRPIIIREGDKAYNRMNAPLLRRCGLGELVVQKPEQVIRKAMDMILDEDYRLALIEKIKNSNIYENDAPKYFRKAIDLITTNHRALMTFKNNKPIVIKRDE